MATRLAPTTILPGESVTILGWITFLEWVEFQAILRVRTTSSLTSPPILVEGLESVLVALAILPVLTHRIRARFHPCGNNSAERS